ncbi:MAG: sigma-70 family RNA polymerase sigma factor [Rhizobacter sp.]|nr:sigma-70 family RNA polymerase sigma factor [Bacteriovorax sp.]
MEDQFLIRQVLKGNKNAYKMLVIRYQRPLFSFFKKFGFTHQKNEDLTQDVFLKSYQFLKNFDADKGTYSSWIFSIAKNMALNEMKKKGEVLYSDDMLENLNLADSEESMENLLELKTSKEFVQKMLPKIPNPFKVPVILSYIEELTLDEIALIEKCSIGTVKSRIFRGKLLLRDLLMKEEMV